MGWNSWNKFGCDVNEETIRRTADALVSTGMHDAGYVYLVIDDCWHGARDERGFIAADAKRFPSGMKALADYVHGKALKFGLYSDAGRRTCGDRPGSQGDEYQDALIYAAWGVDHLKYDWCNTGTRNAEEAYALMSDALKASGRPIVFSLCEWGSSKPWLWAANVGNLWRTTGPRTYSLGMLDIVDRNEPLWPYAGPGHWNDPDMLEVGNGGMTDAEYRAQPLGDDGRPAHRRQRRRQHVRRHPRYPSQQGGDRRRSRRARGPGPPRPQGRRQGGVGEAAGGRGRAPSCSSTAAQRPRRSASAGMRSATPPALRRTSAISGSTRISPAAPTPSPLQSSRTASWCCE